MKKLKDFLLAGICIGAALLLLIFPADITSGFRKGMTVSGSTLLPSLFPFMVLAQFIATTRLGQLLCRPLSPVLRRLRLPPCAGSVMIMGLLGGYPSTAQLVSVYVGKGALTKEQGDFLLCAFTAAGPAFLLSGVGTAMHGSLRFGLLLYISGVLTSVMLAFLFRRLVTETKGRPVRFEPMSSIQGFVEAVRGSAAALISVTAFVCLFASLSFLFESMPLSQGILEISIGCLNACALSPTLSLVLTASFIGFSSLSVICQIGGLTVPCGIGLKHFLFSRFAAAVLQPLCALFLNLLFPVDKQVFSTVNPSFLSFSASVSVSAVLLAVMAILLLSAIEKTVEIRRAI